MKQSIFTGSGTALITPMYPFDAPQNGAINFDVLEQLIEYQISHHTDALIIAGTTGEAPTLTDSEYRELVSNAVYITNGRIPVIAGSGSNHTKTAVNRSLIAKEAGADALLIVTPYYNKTSQSGLVHYFTTCAEAAKLPVILYNVPSRTGVNILPQTCFILSKHPYITALKDATGNLTQMMDTILLCKDDLDIYSGNDDLIVPMLSLGSKGVISVISNLLPKETHDICAFYENGKTAESKKLQFELLPLIHALFADVNPVPVKEVFHFLDIPVGSCRLPLFTIEPAAKEKLMTALNDPKIQEYLHSLTSFF